MIKMMIKRLHREAILEERNPLMMLSDTSRAKWGYQCSALLILNVSLCLFGSGCNLLSGLNTSSDGSEQSTEALQTGETTQSEEVSESKEEPAQPKAAVAEVNGVLIPQSQFDVLFEERARVYRLQKKKLPPRLEKTYRASALQKLIDHTLLQQYFEQLKASLTQEEKDAAFQVYKARFRGEASFQRFLERSGKSEKDLRTQVEFDALVDKVLRLRYADDLAVSDEEVQSYYRQYRERKFVEPAKVRAAHILLAVSSSADKRTAKKRKREALKLLKELRRGDVQTFHRLVREHSDDASTRNRNGDLNYFERKGLPTISEKFEAAATALKVGEISEPVLTKRGYHLIRLTDRQPPQVKVSHILLDPQTDAKTIKKIKNEALTGDFTALAKQYSRDEATRLRGGELGFLLSNRPHRFGNTFRDECLQGKLGEIIGPIESPLGKHIVRITARREERLRASHIQISLPKKPKRAQKREALKKIKQIREELTKSGTTSGSLFIRLAKRHSEHGSSDRGGDLRAFYLGGDPMISASFEEAAFSAKVGEFVGPVRSPFGWHLIYIHDRRERKEKSVDDVRPDIEKILGDKHLRRAKSDLIKFLRSEGEVKRLIEL